MMRVFALVCSLLIIAASAAFKSALPTNRIFKLQSTIQNNIDGYNVPGVLEPLMNNVLVKLNGAETKTASGLLLAPSKEKSTHGFVVAVGPGRHHPETGVFQKTVVSPGVTVVFNNWDGGSLKYNGEKHYIIKDDDILFTYKGEVMNIETAECTKDQILVRLTKKDEKTSSGIYVAPTKEEFGEIPSQVGVVVKVGPGRETSMGQVIPVPVVEGDVIRFREAMSEHFKMGTDEYASVRGSEVLAKVVVPQ